MHTPFKHFSYLHAGLFILLSLSGCLNNSNKPETENIDENLSEILFENTGENCRNFMILAPISEENARKFVPAELTLVQPPIGFVELADCPSGSINGVDSGPYRIAEAAVFITPPDGSDTPAIIGNQAIYLLWQLDNNVELSQLKQRAGFFGAVVDDIELVLEADANVPAIQHGVADVPFTFSPYQLSAQLSAAGPQGPPLPNGLWHAGDYGLIHTHNDIYATDEVLGGIGTITVEEGSALHELFGTTTVTGAAASGIGSFHNTTRLRQDIVATKPETAP